MGSLPLKYKREAVLEATITDEVYNQLEDFLLYGTGKEQDNQEETDDQGGHSKY